MKTNQRLSKIFLAMALTGAASYSLAADTIRIGLAGPVTGPVAQYGDMQFIGAEMAIEQINKAGGVNGQQLEGVRYDDACDPKQAVAVANKIVNDEVQFVVGHLCSSSTQPASDIYEDEGILMISPAATSPDITARGYQMIFRTIGLDSLQGPTAGKFIAEHVKPKTVAVIHDKQQYGEGIATAVKQTLEAAGTKVALFEGINAGDKDFSALIAKMKEAGVELVYHGGLHPEAGLLIRQMADQGVTAKLMSGDGIVSNELAAIAGDAVEGTMNTFAPDPRLREEAKPLVEAFRAEGFEPEAYTMYSYAAVQVVAAAAAAAGSNDTMAIAEALKAKGPFPTVLGELSFNEKGDITRPDYIMYEWRKGDDGKYSYFAK